MNITLIGMPGVGKSTIGKILAKEINYSYLDIDDIIESKDNKKLQKVLSDLGDEKFIIREEKEVLDLQNIANSIISTGGSIVYSEKAMDHLKKISKVIYLSCSIDQLKRRINNSSSRGIVGIKIKSFEELFAERTQLYKKYSDFEIDCESLDQKKIISKIKGLIK